MREGGVRGRRAGLRMLHGRPLLRLGWAACAWPGLLLPRPPRPRPRLAPGVPCVLLRAGPSLATSLWRWWGSGSGSSARTRVRPAGLAGCLGRPAGWLEGVEDAARLGWPGSTACLPRVPARLPACSPCSPHPLPLPPFHPPLRRAPPLNRRPAPACCRRAGGLCRRHRVHLWLHRAARDDVAGVGALPLRPPRPVEQALHDDAGGHVQGHSVRRGGLGRGGVGQAGAGRVGCGWGELGGHSTRGRFVLEAAPPAARSPSSRTPNTTSHLSFRALPSPPACPPASPQRLPHQRGRVCRVQRGAAQRQRQVQGVHQRGQGAGHGLRLHQLVRVQGGARVCVGVGGGVVCLGEGRLWLCLYGCGGR